MILSAFDIASKFLAFVLFYFIFVVAAELALRNSCECAQLHHNLIPFSLYCCCILVVVVVVVRSYRLI